MKDFLGNTLSIGDYVVFIKDFWGAIGLQKGVIVEPEESDCCTVSYEQVYYAFNKVTQKHDILEVEQHTTNLTVKEVQTSVVKIGGN